MLAKLYGPDLAADPMVIALVTGSAFAFGASIGSFLNVCVARMPIMSLVTQYKSGDEAVRKEIVESLDEDPDTARGMMTKMVEARLGLAKPRSHCPTCQQPIAWYDNIPLASWILLGARCRHCRERISPVYPAVELMSGVALALLVWYFGLVVGPIYFAIYAALLVVTGVDLAIYEIPDEIVLPGIPLGILASFVLPVSLRDAVIGAVVGGALPYAIAKGYLLVTKREGMGFGDVKLLAMIGAFFGWQGVVVVLLVASAVGSVVGLGWILATRREARTLIPFGPFLSLGAMVYMVAGPQLVGWYTGSFG